MTSAAIDIVNGGLGLIAQDPIQSFGDGTSKADICERSWTTLRQFITTCYPWRWQAVRDSLTRLDETPIGWTYAYQLPQDMIEGPYRVWNSSSENVPPTRHFEIMGTKLLTNETTIYLEYQQDVEEGNWPDYFVSMAKVGFAAYAAMPLTENASLADYWMREAFGTPTERKMGGMMGSCRVIDAKRRPPSRLNTDNLLAARFR